MFCPKCGSQASEDAQFCEACGADMKRSVPQEKKKAPVKAIALAVVAAIVVVAIAVIVFVLSLPPVLSNDEILSNIDEGSFSSQVLVRDEWTGDDPYEVVSENVDSVEDSEFQGTKSKVAHATTICENAYYRVTSSWEFDYLLRDESWVLEDTLEVGRIIEPIGGVSDDKVLEQVPLLMQKVDENPPLDSEGKKKLLKNLYVENTSFQVMENDFSNNACDVHVSIGARQGAADYKGTLTAHFSWDGSQWALSDVSADTAAYTADYGSLVGTWTGTLAKTKNPGDDVACYGGRAQPAVLVVKSVSGDALTATVDISFLLHNHLQLDNVAEATEGDTYQQLSDVLIPLKTGKSDFYEVYKGTEPITYELYLEVRDDGTLGLRVYGYKYGKALKTEAAQRDDYYDMAKTA